MHGTRKQQYLNSFVMVDTPSELTPQATIGNCYAAVAHTPDVDSSLVSQPTIEQCKLVGGIHKAVCAMQYACANSIPLAQLSCPHCDFPVLDTEEDNTLATAKHVCKNAACAGEFRNRSKAFGNPLAAYKLENNRLIPN